MTVPVEKIDLKIMIQKTTFGEEKFNLQRVIQLVIFLIVIIGLGIGGFLVPASQPKLPRLLWFFAALSAVIMPLWFYRLFLSQKKEGITCDSNGCEVKRRIANLHGGSRFDVTTFGWLDTTETKVSDKAGYSGNITSSFSLNADGKHYPLIDTTHADFRPLLNYVNNATQHLPYEWIPRKEAGNRQILEYGEYCKVQRS
jgi:hypothetical protein